MQVTGIILAGGKSSRMGTDKGLVKFKGKPMVKHLIDLFIEMNIQPIIISNNPIYEQFNTAVYPDLIKDKGPAGGIYTGLKHSTTENNIIVSCDSPLITKETLSFLLEKHEEFEITVPSYQNRIHPLIGIYSSKCLSMFKNKIEESELKIRKIINSLNTQIIEVDDAKIKNIGQVFSNINTVDELKNLEQ